MAKPDIKRPIFIFGNPNSGTTVLWQLLRLHNDVSGPASEGQDLEGLPKIMTHWLGNDTFRLWAHPKFSLCYYVTEQDYDELDKDKVEEIYKQSWTPGTRFLTKSPADTLRARLIQAYFPDAYFIALVRNGYAVSEGIRRKRFDDPVRPKFKGLETTIEDAAEQWHNANKVIVDHKQHLHNYMILKYEDMMDNPENALTSALKFCDLSLEGFPFQSLRKLSQTSLSPEIDYCFLTNSDPSPLPLVQDLNQQQISRLSIQEIQSITTIARPMLEHFGYEIL